MNDSVVGDIPADMGENAKRGIGRRIRRLRKHLDRTQEQFGSLVGTSRGAVTNWERGGGISLDHVAVISERTGVRPGWIMSGPDEGPIPFLDGVQRIAEITGDLTIALEDAASLITWVIQAIGDRVGEEAEAEARVLARAVLRAVRTPPDPTQSPLSADQLRSRVFDVIELFRSR
jgi:transcriptional regulator with XRE-family HTH domain